MMRDMMRGPDDSIIGRMINAQPIQTNRVITHLTEEGLTGQIRYSLSHLFSEQNVDMTTGSGTVGLRWENHDGERQVNPREFVDDKIAKLAFTPNKSR